MPVALSTLAGTLTSLALAGAILKLAQRLQALERREPPGVALEGAAGHDPRRRSPPLLAALYQEPRPSPLAALTTASAGTWLVGALLLGLITVATAPRPVAPLAAPLPGLDSTVAQLQDRVDSLAGIVQRLRDSVALSPASHAAPPITRLARRIPPGSALLPAAPPPPTFAPSPVPLSP